jgi:protein SCO1/2
VWPPASLATGVVAAATLLAGCSASSGATAAHGFDAPGASVGQRIDAALPGAVTAPVLVASTGRRVSLASLSGRVLVVSDMMTLCQETCPLDTANVVAAAQAVERAGLGSKVEFLSISIDPRRDTPERLAAYRKLYAPAPADWLVATGTSAQLASLWKALGVYIQRVPDTPPAPRDWLTGTPLTYDLTHSDEVFFIDRRGHERFVLDGPPHVSSGAPIPARLKKFLDGDGRQNLTHPNTHAWTLPQELQVLSWLLGHRIPAGSN